MSYRVYSGPRGSAAIAPLDKERMLYKECDSLDAALGWARHLAQGDRVALLIEGDDGTRLGKEEIAAALRHAENPFPGKGHRAPQLSKSPRPGAGTGGSIAAGSGGLSR
jgi:hypothetical protein